MQLLQLILIWLAVEFTCGALLAITVKRYVKGDLGNLR